MEVRKRLKYTKIRTRLFYSDLTLKVTCILNNYIKKTTRCTFCMYLFYNFCTTLRVSNDHFVHHQEFMICCILQLCTNHANVSRDTESASCWFVYIIFPSELLPLGPLYCRHFYEPIIELEPFLFAESLQGPHEKRLLHTLLDHYNVLERPVLNESDPLQLSFGLTLMQIIDVVSSVRIPLTYMWLGYGCLKILSLCEPKF